MRFISLLLLVSLLIVAINASNINVKVDVNTDGHDHHNHKEESSIPSVSSESEEDLPMVGAATYGSCNWDGAAGTCMDYRSCSGRSTTKPLCPGNDAIRCCVPNAPAAPKSWGSCSTAGMSGTCMDYRSCGGYASPANLCPGNADIRCCLPRQPSSGGGGASGNNAGIRNRMAQEVIKGAQPNSIGWCAKYVRQAINRAGVPLTGTNYAKDFGPLLERVGFRPVSGGLEPGDVRVIQSYPGGNPAGHMQMYTSQGWYSDFRQRDEWPGSGYRSYRPRFVTYRYSK